MSITSVRRYCRCTGGSRTSPRMRAGRERGSAMVRKARASMLQRNREQLAITMRHGGQGVDAGLPVISSPLVGSRGTCKHP